MKVVKLNERDIEGLVKKIIQEHNFRIGDAVMFQDKPSQDTRRAIQSMHRSEDERAFKLVGDLIYEIADILSEEDKTDADLSVVLKSLVRGTRILRREKETNGDDPKKKPWMPKIKPTPIVNENRLADWVRKKRFSDEDLGLLILKGLEKGDVQAMRHSSQHGGSQHQYNCRLDGHDIQSSKSISLRSGSNYYSIRVDDEFIETSDSTTQKIYELMADIENEPTKREKNRKMSDVRTRLSAYNLPDEERKQIENTDKYFS